MTLIKYCEYNFFWFCADQLVGFQVQVQVPKKGGPPAEVLRRIEASKLRKKERRAEESDLDPLDCLS